MHAKRRFLSVIVIAWPAFGAHEPTPPSFRASGAGHHELPHDLPALKPAAPPGIVRTHAGPWRQGSFESVQVNVNPSGQNIPFDAANEPSIAVDPTNPDRIVIGWRQFDSVNSDFRQAGWAYSHDGGQTWTFPGVLEPDEFSSDPVLEVDADGNFYYYSLQPDRGPVSLSCYLYKSFDGGLTWPQEVFAWGGDKAWMTVDRTSGIGRGHFYALSDAVGAPGNFTRSTDGGLTFLKPFDIPVGIWGTLAVGVEGELYACSRGIQFARSDDAQNAGVTPTFDLATGVNLGGVVTANVQGSPNPGGLLGQVWVDCDRSGGPTRGHVYLLASVDPPGADPLDVMFARSTDRGATWGAPIRINHDPLAGHAWQWFGTLSVAPGGRIDVIWNDTRADPTVTYSRLYYTNSQDGGVTWLPETPLSPPFNHFLGYPNQAKLGDYYDMVSLDGAAYIAYAATFQGEQDVYFLRISFDCNHNGVPDHEDIASGSSQDCTHNGIPDECEPDCNGNGAADSCDIASGTSQDCAADGVPDECEPDCNSNGLADSCDLSGGTSADCNATGIPDDCELGSNDCNTNGTPDDCEVGTACEPDRSPSGSDIDTACPGVTLFAVSTGGSVRAAATPFASSGSNVFADSFGQVRWNSLGMQAAFAPPVSNVSIDVIATEAGDASELTAYNAAGLCGSDFSAALAMGQSETLTVSCAQGIAYAVARSAGCCILLDHLVINRSAMDCDGNGVPDECDPDCNANGTGDGCDIFQGTSQDCNRNTVPDDCELSAGTSVDCNANGVPDQCDIAASNLIYDCNLNGAPDGCDIANAVSGDCDTDGIPDECEAEICHAAWDGFEPSPPFVVGTPIGGIDSDGDGVAWQNPSDTATIANQGCPASTGKALKIVSQTPPTSDYVLSEYFGALDDGAPIQSVTFDVRSEAQLNPRIDWQLTFRDATNDQTVILIHWASTQSSFAGVTGAQGGNGRGRILVQNPAGSPAFINSGFAIPVNSCYRLRVTLDNLTGTVELSINGTLRVSMTRLQDSALRLDGFRLEQKANGQSSGGIQRLALDNFIVCQTGGALAPGGVPDCNGNQVWDACDLASGTSADSNGNGTPDDCEGAPAATVTGAVSRKGCDLVLPLSPTVGSEPRQGGPTEVRIEFDAAPGGPGSNPVSIAEKTCPPPGTYAPYAGASQVSASVTGDQLVLLFTPRLENARTYRLTLGADVTSIAGQFVEIRGLVGDVNSDGRVNGTDRSAVVDIWVSTNFSCATDLDGNGRTHGADRSIVVGAWTSGQNCAP